ncbi:hypothetical protein D3C75_241660 [compost metagenome]
MHGEKCVLANIGDSRDTCLEFINLTVIQIQSAVYLAVDLSHLGRTPFGSTWISGG